MHDAAQEVRQSNAVKEKENVAAEDAMPLTVVQHGRPEPDYAIGAPPTDLAKPVKLTGSFHAA